MTTTTRRSPSASSGRATRPAAAVRAAKLPENSGRAAAHPDSSAAVLKRAQAAAARTRWEDHLWRDIRAAHLPEPARQYHWHPQRRYRSDFAYVPERLLVEVQGGVWGRYNARTGEWEAGKRSGHSGGTGMEDDCRRTCDALEHGWRILPVTPDMVASGEAVARIERVLAAIWQETRRRRTRSGGAA